MKESLQGNYREKLENDLGLAFAELAVKPEDETALRGFIATLKNKDPATYEHSLRVAFLTRKIGGVVGLDGRPLLFAGLLHDLGKLEIPSETLHKSGNWTPADSLVMRDHVMAGYLAIKDRFPFTAEIILLHHKFQSDGYPEVVPPYLHDYSPHTRDLILECARMLALADVYDALHRTNDKFGQTRTLTGEEIKTKMLELNPDRTDLIENLYASAVFV